MEAYNDKLININQILELAFEVQKKWVYLENIFLNSQEIQTQLNNEYRKFMAINNGFCQIMKKITAKQPIIEVLGIAQIKKTLEGLIDSLEKI